MYICANCKFQGCGTADESKMPNVCPTREHEEQEKIKDMYHEEENKKISYNSALVEAEGYCRQTRLEETIVFLKKCNYRKIGLAFCMGLSKEANQLEKILESHGFDVVSVICKNGAIPKSEIGIGEDEKIAGADDDIMCNPIGQAILLNKMNTEFNILLGLCVGHDSLVIKYSNAPVTVFAVKDRVLGHNPLAAVYLSESYYKDRLFRDK